MQTLEEKLLSILHGSTSMEVLRQNATDRFIEGYSKFMNVAHDDYGFHLMKFVKEVFKRPTELIEGVGDRSPTKVKPFEKTRIGMQQFQEQGCCTWACSLEYIVGFEKLDERIYPFNLIATLQPASSLLNMTIKSDLFEDTFYKLYDLSIEKDLGNAVELFRNPTELLQYHIDNSDCSVDLLSPFL